jgi:hypothetical protein
MIVSMVHCPGPERRSAAVEPVADDPAPAVTKNTGMEVSVVSAAVTHVPPGAPDGHPVAVIFASMLSVVPVDELSLGNVALEDAPPCAKLK